MAETFAGFESYRLNGVRLTEEEFGRGSYAVVLRLEYRGLKCAGKQLYNVLYEQGVGDTVRRFEKECWLLAQMRHPNIVQFIGIYFEEGSHVPILVMEFLPTTLAKCIDRYGVLPEEVSYSILHDVAVGLYHLHSRTPPIVHRDLSANNVLLASNMTAKISDLGVARILNLTPQQMSRMTCTPGTPAYMPPEAIRANPRYDARIDQFSYGILMIHVLSGRWPLPVCEAARPDPRNPDQLIPVSEADRREEYLQDISSTHPLMDLILRCVSNNPARRARAAEIVQQIGNIVHQFPPSFANRVKMLQRIETETNEKQTLQAECQRLAAEAKLVRTKVTAEFNAQNAQLREEIQTLEQLVQHHQGEFERSEVAYSVEIAEAQSQLARSKAFQIELKSQKETFQARLRSQNEMHKVELMAQIESIEQERRSLSSELKTLETELTKVCRVNRNLQATVVSKNKELLSKDREILSKRAEILATKEEKAKMASEQERLQAVVLSKDEEIESKQQEVDAIKQEASVKSKLIATLHMENSAKKAALAVKNVTINQKMSVLEQQSSTIQGLNKALTRAREFLSGQSPQSHHLLHPQAKITWEPCSDLPVKMSAAHTVVIRDKVYCGGGDAADDDKYRVFCYNPSEDTWNTLPPYPVRYFGLGQLRGKLVAVGGVKKSSGKVTNEVYEFDEVTQSWMLTIPHMSTARHSAAVLSHHFTLIVAGGVTSSIRTSIVEILREETSQWHTTEPLPFGWSNISSVLINNWWYLLGGAAEEESRVVCAHVYRLLQKVLPRDQSSTEKDSTNNSAWEVLPNTPHYTPAAATLGASFLAVGGTTTSSQETVNVYSPYTNEWIHISDLPAPRVWAATAMPSATELLVIGGWNKGRKNSVYKGLLQIE